MKTIILVGIRAYLAACSLATGAILCSVDNNGPSIQQNAASLIQLIRSLEKSISA